MKTQFLIAVVMLLAAFPSHGQWFGSGPELKSMAEFADGKFQFETKFDLGWYYVVKWRDLTDPHVQKVKPLTGRGVLYLPAESSKKVPAIVLIHHSGGLYFPTGGIRRNFPEWAETLARSGIAVVLLDVYSPRKLNRTTNQNRRYNWDAVYDAFRVRALLQTHPRIDPDKIGIGGMSMGGTAALFAFDSRVPSTWADDGRPFAFHVAVYPTCSNQFYTWRPTTTPLLIMNGELDEYVGLDHCYDLEKKLGLLGAKVESITYKGAYHSWDEDYAPTSANDRSNRFCRWWMMDGGGWRTFAGELLDTDAKANAYYDSCAVSDPKLTMVGRNEEAFQQSKQDMVNFIRRVTN
jgi:dienelactone hydrolase